MQEYVDGESHLILDDRLAPIMVSTWDGPASLANVRRFQDWAEAAAEQATGQGRPAIFVTNVLSAGIPTTEVRKAFSDRVLTTDFRNYVIVTSSVVRGAMTAVRWLMGDGFHVTPCKSLDEGLTLAASFAREHGLVTPPRTVLDDYRRDARTVDITVGL